MSDSRRLRFAFVLFRYFPFGGMQRSMLRLAQYCALQGHTVDIWTAHWEGERPTEQQIRVRLLPITAWSNHGRNRQFARALHRQAQPHKYDCIVGFDRMPGLDVYYAGEPCLAHRLHHEKTRFHKWLPRYRTLLAFESAVFKSSARTKILLIAHQEKERFVRQYGTAEERFVLLPPGIQRDRLVPFQATAEGRQQLWAEQGMEGGEKLVLLIGSGFRTKGVDRAIRALASLPLDLQRQHRLVIVGRGDSQAYAKLATNAGVGDRVNFAGPRKDVQRFYHYAELLVHPARTENTGTVLVEAMVCGLPVLTTDNCGFAFHVRNAGAGWVCSEPFCQQSFNAALEACLRKTDRNVWSENARRYTQQADLYSLIDQAGEVLIRSAFENRIQREQARAEQGDSYQ